MLDNFIYSFGLDLENGIPIKPYYKGKDDYELEYLCEALLKIKDEPEATTLVDFVNKSLGLDKFYTYLGNKEDGQEDDDNMRDSRMTIARRSVIIGGRNESNQQTQKNVTYVSPQRTQIGNPSLSPSFQSANEPKLIQGSSNYSYLSQNYSGVNSPLKSSSQISQPQQSYLLGNHSRSIRDSLNFQNSASKSFVNNTSQSYYPSTLQNQHNGLNSGVSYRVQQPQNSSNTLPVSTQRQMTDRLYFDDKAFPPQYTPSSRQSLIGTNYNFY